MEKRESIQSMLENQSEMRDRLLKVLENDPKPRHILAAEIGISHVSMRRFLVEGLNLRLIPFLKIKKFVETCEKEVV